MANKGPDSNASQFMITLGAAPELDGKHIRFGEVLYGQEVMKLIEKAGSELGTPVKDVVIADCGIIEKSNWVDAHGNSEAPSNAVSIKEANDLEEAWEDDDDVGMGDNESQIQTSESEKA